MPVSSRELPGALARSTWLGGQARRYAGGTVWHVEAHGGEARTWASWAAMTVAAAPGEESVPNGAVPGPWGCRGVRQALRGSGSKPVSKLFQKESRHRAWRQSSGEASSILRVEDLQLDCWDVAKQISTALHVPFKGRCTQLERALFS